MQVYCRVAIDSPVGALDRPFDYAIPERMLGLVAVGSVVRVVLHGRNMRAFVTELLDQPAVAEPRPLSSLVSPEPLFSEETIRLAAWTARRYVVPLGLVLHDAVPGRFSAPTATERSSSAAGVAKPGWLVGDLASLIASGRKICVVIPSTAHEPELVAHAISEATAAQMRSLVICPRVDIAERLAGVIDGAAVMHGEDRPADRAAAWAAAREGRVDVVIGGRSALFAPLPKLGLVMVVSAHDRSLKSERAPRVHAMVVARQRARLAGAAFIASSPAPPVEIASGESVVRVEARRSAVRPQTARPRRGPITPQLLRTITWALDRNTHALVFAGRRGDVLRLRCADCGWTPTCAACGTGLALEASRLICRVCGRRLPTPESCVSCDGQVTQRGWGHERIARELDRAELAPVVRVVAGEPLGELPEPTIIVGTLAAVHSVAEAGAVCVADLDQLLRRPDFRASEFALQTLHEIAGVLAPGGRFLMQTREPEHHVVQAFTRGSYRYFLDRELPYREETGYPPFGAVVRVDVEATALADLERDLRSAAGRVVGAISRKGRLTALLRAPQLEPLLDPLRRFALAYPRTKIDVDPVDVA